MKASNFQFLNPYLEEMFFAGNDNFDMNEDIEMENSFNVQVKKDKENRRAKVELVLETNVNVEDAPFRMRVKVASDFKWDNLDDESVEAMLKCNAPALLLSYMRPIVANITNVSKFPVYNLPFVNFQE